MVRFQDPSNRWRCSIFLLLLTLSSTPLWAQTPSENSVRSNRGTADTSAKVIGKSDTQFSYLPHITAVDGSFATSIEVVNLVNFERDYTLEAFDTEGNLLETVTQSLEPFTQAVFDPVALFGSDRVSHIRVTTFYVDVASVYRAMGTDGSPVRVSAREDCGDLWMVPLGNPEVTYDGLAVINLGDTSARITARFLDHQGNELDQQILSEQLAPLAKHLAVLSALAPEDAGSVEILSDTQLMLTALRGDYQSRFLWENQTGVYQSQDLGDTCAVTGEIAAGGIQ